MGHSYNLIEASTSRILNVETASRKRVSVYEVGKTPFFHANMYLHLHINQASEQKYLVFTKKSSKQVLLPFPKIGRAHV